MTDNSPRSSNASWERLSVDFDGEIEATGEVSSIGSLKNSFPMADLETAWSALYFGAGF